jgi:hypothetical protein
MAEASRPQWYVQLSGIEEGPITSQTLRSLAEGGRIYPDTPIRKEGMMKTVPAGKIRGLLRNSAQLSPSGSQEKLHATPSSRTSHENRPFPKERMINEKPTVSPNNPRAENTVLKIANKGSFLLLMTLAVIAILSPIRVIILQAAVVITGLWPLITGRIWLVDDKYTVKSSTARTIGALLVSSAPLSFIGGMFILNQNGYTRDAKTYGTLLELAVFGIVAIVSYIVYRMVRHLK